MTGPHARQTLFLAIVLLLTCGLMAPIGVAGQEVEVGTDLFFDTVDVQVVNLEVVVTAADGPSVTGLTADDFEVLVDGQPVAISNFFEVVSRQTVVVGTGPIEGPAPTVEEYLPSPDTERLNLVVVLDDVNMRAKNRNIIFDRLTDYLWGEFDRRDRFMLAVMDGAMTVHQPFTNDPGLLVQTLDQLRKKVGGPAGIDAQERLVVRQLQGARLAPNPGASLNSIAQGDFIDSQLVAERIAGDLQNLAEIRFQAVRASLRAIQEFTDSLAGLQGRKAVVYVSDGLPVRAADSLAQAWMNKYSTWIAQQNVDSLLDEMLNVATMGTSSRFDAGEDLDELVARAAINQVAFYPISYSSGGSRSHISPEFAGANTITGLGPTTTDVVALDQIGREAPLLRMAEKTGGVASMRGSNVLDLLRQVVADFATFYSLGYTPPDGIDEEVHEVEVRVKAPGLKVRHLETYQQKAPLDELRDLTLSALHHGMENNPLNVRLDPGQATNTKGGRYRVPVLVKIPFRQLLLLPEQDYHLGRVTLFVVARDERGGVSPFQHVEMPIRIPNARLGEAMQGFAAYELQLEVKRGRQRIAIGVRDHLAKVDATVNLELDVGRKTS